MQMYVKSGRQAGAWRSQRATRLQADRGRRDPGGVGVKTLSAVSSMKSGEGITASRIDEHAQYPCYGGNQDVVSDAFTQDTESVVIRSS